MGINYDMIASEPFLQISEIVVTAILGLSVLGSTIIFNRSQSKIAKHRLQKDLFGEFNKRYDVLNGYLEKITKYDSIEQLMDKKPNKYPFLRNKLNDYFNLCAEEYYWYKNDRIDKDLWKSWEVGMNAWYNNHKIIREAWSEEYESFGHHSFYLKKDEQFFKSQ
jgi:hypothetical protein